MGGMPKRGRGPAKSAGDLIRENGVTRETSVAVKNCTLAPSPAKRWAAVNERNLRIGESHPRAVLTDHDVELVLELRDDGHSYRWIAMKMEVSLAQIFRICTGKQRSQIPSGHRRVK
jgi:hypothetical protein